MQNLRTPLNNLLKKRSNMWLDKGLLQSFQKKFLMLDLFLAHFNLKQEIVVVSDANDYRIGVVILHRFEDGMAKHQCIKNSPVDWKELLPNWERRACDNFHKFHRFVHVRKFVSQMDHHPLLSIFGSKKGIPTHTANRLQHWETILLN